MKPSPKQIEDRIICALGDGELTAEVQGAISVAKQLVKEAFNAGIAVGRERGLEAGRKIERTQHVDPLPPKGKACSICWKRSVKETGDVCRECVRTWTGKAGVK